MKLGGLNLESTHVQIENVHKLENSSHSDLVISVWLDLVSVHICVKYERRGGN